MEEVQIPRNLGIEMVRVTEAAAISAARLTGLGRPEEADQLAAEAMAAVLHNIRIDGTIVMGEEDRPGHAAVFKSQMKVGKGEGARVDVLVDPIDGRTQLAKGFPNAMACAALAPLGSIWVPPHAVYMEKIIVDDRVAEYLVEECLDAPPAWTLALVARAKRVNVSDLTVFILDRPRHAELINEIRTSGAHVMLRSDGDITGALMVCNPGSGVDLMMGVGGIPEVLLSACAVKALRGAMIARLKPQTQVEEQAVHSAGYDPHRILSANDLVKSEQVFFTATGITDGSILSGVLYHGGMAETNSLILRCETGTRRRVYSEHLLDKWVAINA